MSELKRFHNQIAVITGAGRGIGLNLAKQLANEGATVALLDLNKEAAEAGANAINAVNGRAVAWCVDVTSEASVQTTIRQIVENCGTPTILVNNAGLYPHIPLADLSYDDWRKIMAVNLDGTFLCSRAVLAPMKAAGYGRIVNLSSAVVFTGLTGVSAYAASKAAVIGFTRVLATEAGAFGITANAVAPGLIQTEGVMTQIAEHFDDILPSQAIPRRGQPQDIAEAIMYLASPAAGFITGQTIAVNGGLHYY